MLYKSLPSVKIIQLFLLLVLIFLLIFFMFNPFKKSLKYEVVKTLDFSCPELTGFAFRYPVFKDWEVKGIRGNGQERCSVFFNWPNIIEYEIAPQITIEKSTKLGQKFITEKLSGNENSESVLDDSGMNVIGIVSTKKKNSNGVPYEYITDFSQYVKDHVFKVGDWDWLVFYGQDFGIKISRSMFGSLHENKEVEKQKLYEFDSDIFYKTIIESFKFESKESSMWNNIKDTTWQKDNNWAGESYVFYENNNTQKRCIHQTYGSGVHVVDSQYAEIDIIDEKRVKINNNIYEYQDNKLVSGNSVLTLYEKKPLVYNKSGLVDMKIVRSSNFDIRNIEK